ncbi:MAG: glycerophosphoryl diester phosphodiesterase membrane domain-containing protein, partial [Planctomycetota bacterium]
MNPFRRVREANRLTLRVAGPALLYGLGVGLLSTLVLAPLLLWLLAGALAVTAGGTVLNWDLTDFTLSLPAVAMLALGAIAVSVLTVVGFGGHVLITAAGAEGRRVSLPRVLGEVGVALTRIRGMGVLKVAALVVLLLPTVAAVAGLLAGLLLAPFQREETLRLGLRALPPAWMLVLAGAAFFVGATCYVRWSFAMHAVMLEGTTLGRGIRRSVEMVRGRFWSLAALHAVHQVGLAILLGVVALLLGLAGRLALAVIPFGDAAASRWGLALLLVIDTVILAVATTLGVVRGIAVLTQAWLDHGGGRARLDRSRADVPSQASTSVVWRRRPWATVGLVLVATGGMTVLALPGVGKELEAMDRPVNVTAHR